MQHLVRPTDRPARLLFVLALMVAPASSLAGCSGTTYDASLASSTTVVAATTTTLPSGPAVELLPRLVAEAESVPQLMIDGGDARAAVERLTALWEAARDEVRSTRPDLVEGFEQQVARFDQAVQYKRVADADKSLRNLVVLVEAFLA
jgi:hypothetical protein